MSTMQKFRPELNAAPGDAVIKVKIGNAIHETSGCEYTPGGAVIITAIAKAPKKSAKKIKGDH
jgi:hypothetical protein